MQKFISKYGLAAHLALLAVTPLFLFPYFSEGGIAAAVMWMALVAFGWLVMEPSRLAGEMLHDARERVTRGILRDPFFWCSLGLLVVAGIRWANGGVEQVYDAELAEWQMTSPVCEILPGSVDGSGMMPFALLTGFAVVALGFRHALGKRARAACLLMTSAFAGIAALVAVALAFEGQATAEAARTCAWTNPQFVGVAFALHVLSGILALEGIFDYDWKGSVPLLAFALGGTVTGLVYFAPPLAIAVGLSASLLLLALCLVHRFLTVSAIDALKFLIAFALSLLVPVLVLIGCAPEGMLAEKFPYFAGGSLFSEDYWAMRAVLSEVASKAWQVHPWLGTGAGSFALDIGFQASPEDWKVLQMGQGAALNGWRHLMAERGIVGLIEFVLAVGPLLWTFGRRLYFGIRSRKFLFPSATVGVLALALVVAEAFFDVSLLRCDVMLALGALLTVSASSLPRVKTDDDDSETN